MSGLKRVTIVVIKGIGIIAALAFWFSPVTTYPGILWFAAAIIVGLLCVVALSALDDALSANMGTNGIGQSHWIGVAHRTTAPTKKPTDSRVD